MESLGAVAKAEQILSGEPYWHQRNNEEVEDSEYNDDQEILKKWFEFSTLSDENDCEKSNSEDNWQQHEDYSKLVVNTRYILGLNSFMKMSFQLSS